MNKKAQIFMPLMVIFMVAIFTTALLVLSHKFNVQNSRGETRYLGSQQFEVFNTYQKGENAKFFISTSAKLAAKDTIAELAMNSSDCGEYFGFSIWSNADKECYPSSAAILEKMKTSLGMRLNDYLNQYTDAQLQQDDYDFSLTQGDSLKIIGTSKNPLSFDFGVFSGFKCEGGDLTKLNTVSDQYLRSCFQYDGIFLASLKSHNLANIEPLFMESLARWESLCNPLVNAGGIMQVDAACLTPTPSVIRYDSSQSSKWVCPSPQTQIDAGIMEFAATFNQVQDLTLTLFAYNRGIAAAEKARQYFQAGGTTIQDAMTRACIEVFLPSTNPQDGRTWREEFTYQKSISRNPDECFANSQTPEEYYCTKCGGGVYAGRILATYEQACTQIGGKLVKTTDQSSGTYSIPSNFKFELPYSFSEYDALQPAVKEIAEQAMSCKAKPSEFDDCFGKVLISRTDFKWDANCETEYEKLAETIYSCTSSGQEGYCDYRSSTVAKALLALIPNKDTGKTDISIEQSIDQATPYVVSSVSGKDVEFESCESITLTRGKLQGMKCGAKQENPYWTYTDGLQFYVKSIQGKPTIAFIDPSVLQTNRAKLAQILLKKNQINICANSTKYGFLDGTGTKSPVVYRISFRVGDKVPPKPVQNIAVKYTPIAEENVTVSFDANTELDVAYYNVYYGETDFTTVDNKPSVLGRVQVQKDVKRYSQTFKIPKDGQKYYYAVVAFDADGNKDPNVKTVEYVSQDDLRPGPIKGIQASPVQGLVTAIFDVAITPPDANEDGTPIKDLVDYNLYLGNEGPNGCSEQAISAILTSPISTLEHQHDKTQVTIPDRNRAYCLVVLANDETGNAPQRPAQYSANSITELKI